MRLCTGKNFAPIWPQTLIQFMSNALAFYRLPISACWRWLLPCCCAHRHRHRHLLLEVNGVRPAHSTINIYIYSRCKYLCHTITRQLHHVPSQNSNTYWNIEWLGIFIIMKTNFLKYQPNYSIRIAANIYQKFLLVTKFIFTLIDCPQIMSGLTLSHCLIAVHAQRTESIFRIQIGNIWLKRMQI